MEDEKSPLKNIRFAKNGDEIRVKLTIANPEHPERRVEAEFLVDTGATGCAVTEEIAKKLGLRKVGKSQTMLADGSVRDEDVVWLYLNVNGEHIFTIATSGSYIPLLGFDIMRMLGLLIDPRRKKLFRPIRMRRVKRILLSKWVSVNSRGKHIEHN